MLRPSASTPAAPAWARYGRYSGLLPEAPRIELSAPPPLVPLTTIRSALPGIAVSLRRRYRTAALASTAAAGDLPGNEPSAPTSPRLRVAMSVKT